MKRKVIATGLSGLVGSRVAELLGKKLKFIDFSLDSGVDITNFNLLKKKFSTQKEAETVLHLAAFTDVNSAWEQKGDKNDSCFRVNVQGSKNIAQLCQKTNKYLIHISTDFVFSGNYPPAGGYRETDQPQPIEWYGQTKLWAEKEVQKSDARYSILRISFPYKAKKSSPRLEPQPKLDLVRKIKTKLTSGRVLSMYSDQIITPTFIDDIAKAVGLFIQRKPKGIFHVVGSTSLSPYDLACQIADVFQLDKSLINKGSLEKHLRENPTSRPRQKKMVISNRKLEEEMGIKMATVEEGLKEIKKQEYIAG